MEHGKGQERALDSVSLSVRLLPFFGADQKEQKSNAARKQLPRLGAAFHSTLVTSTARDALILRRAGGVSPRMKRTESEG